jgi:hypothetical protein
MHWIPVPGTRAGQCEGGSGVWLSERKDSRQTHATQQLGNILYLLIGCSRPLDPAPGQGERESDEQCWSAALHTVDWRSSVARWSRGETTSSG